MAPVLAIAVVLCGVAYGWQARRFPRLWIVPVLILAAGLIWGLITVAWSLEPARGARTIAKSLWAA